MRKSPPFHPCPNMEETELPLFVRTSDSHIKRVITLNSLPVKNLQMYFPNEEKVFVYNGQILNEDAPLSFYGIMPNVTIEGLPKVHTQNENKDFGNDDEFNSSWSNFVRSLKIQCQEMRLRDIICNRIENRRSFHRRFIQMNQSHLLSKDNGECYKLNISYPELKEPSQAQLPICWICCEE